MMYYDLIQAPAPGDHLVGFKGDIITFTLSLKEDVAGRAWLRTNLGHASAIRKEIIRRVSHDEPILGRGWYDIPMTALDSRSFTTTVALCETGHFEAKCLFLPEDEKTPLWPAGRNVSINIGPSDTCCANIIYNAFVRQFGPNKSGTFYEGEENSDTVKRLDKSGYTVIPPSGTFRDLIAQLDFIIGNLGCRILHLLPINPTPTTYGRMGRFGSPYAALDFTAIDPALAVFDPKATPLEQFVELVDAIHARNAKIIIDLAPNHTGWAAELHETHPQWLVRDKEGKIEAPGAWGVVWADLTRLNYHYKELWMYMADVFLTWCRRGVDGFRCDAGYMIPVPAWNYIISAVRDEFPDTIFFLEGLGGKISVTRDLLNISDFNWAYSELFQNYDRGQIEHYLPEPLEISKKDGVMVHFAETHDNNRLAAASQRYASMRTALCALSSSNGGFGFANGVEWYATEKINVHDAKSLNWGAAVNQTQWIRRINYLLRNHPAFFDQTDISMIQKGQGNHLVILRHHRPSKKKLLVLVNLDADHPATAAWKPADCCIYATTFTDLLSEKSVTVIAQGDLQSLNLSPGQVLCLTPDPNDLKLFAEDSAPGTLIPDRIYHQCLRAAALEVRQVYFGDAGIGDFNPDAAAVELAKDPVEFCRKMNRFSDETRVIIWQWPADCKRSVMIPPDHFLMVKVNSPFRATITRQSDSRIQTIGVSDSLRTTDGSYFALFSPRPAPSHHLPATLRVSIFQNHSAQHVEGPLLYLAHSENIAVKKIYTRREILKTPLRFVGTNNRGAMMRAHASWGKIESKYDALLAANLHPAYPVDRTMQLIRCRAWIVFQGYSSEVSMDCLDRFGFDYDNRCFWRFRVPCGQGQNITLDIMAEMIRDENRIQLTFTRRAIAARKDQMPAQKTVELILRPDIDDRSFHTYTKAYLGPEHLFRSACKSRPDGFLFSPYPHHSLDVCASCGEFFFEPEWQYMAYLPIEAERGMDANTDLFSPGYFRCQLKGDDTVRLTATGLLQGESLPKVLNPAAAVPYAAFKSSIQQAPGEAMTSAVNLYIAKRDSLKTIIAGYPWFLDWGRDTLIVVRGLISAGFIEESKTILKQFAKFEKNGTLPNIIHGETAENRDTSDAPLWLFVACDDILRRTGNADFLNESCGGRTIGDVLISIATSYIQGTPNGIHVDPKTNMVFSPSHFTWMDTNFPAATPRQGYPIEIQALWYYALKLLSQVDKSNKKINWAKLAGQLVGSIEKLFFLRQERYLADCLFASSGTSALNAQVDDSLRPNQLFAVTLGAVTSTGIIRRVVAACESLIVPGAIRSLADRPVKFSVPVIHQGRSCNDPSRPYKGIYTGDEDTQRKPAYHNGTAWTWVFPVFCEAWAIAFGDAGKKTARDLLASSCRLINSGSVGQIPEIVDGDFPHTQRGCDAQAWGVSEFVRVWSLLENNF